MIKAKVKVDSATIEAIIRPFLCVLFFIDFSFLFVENKKGYPFMDTPLCNYLFTRAFNDLPGVNTGATLAGIVIVSPV